MHSERRQLDSQPENTGTNRTSPWYRTWWFILGCAILIATIIIETFRRTLKRNQKKN